MNYKETYQEWLSNPYFDEDTKKELTAIENDENEIKERFYADLAFGTLWTSWNHRCFGINRMNIYVVRKATQGLADYILEQGTDKKRVAIAFDSRHMSPEFADEAARTLAANGIKAFIFESLRPTPELSFAVRHLDCIAGINVTATITHLSTMDTKYTGKMVLSLQILMLQVLQRKLMRSLTFQLARQCLKKMP